MSKEFKPMKFGCGRYIQAPGALEIVGREATMLRSKKALVVCGKKAMDAVGAKMEASLKSAGVEPYFYVMTSDCTYETLDYLQNTLIPQLKPDLVIGSGGGKVVDMAKAAGKCSGLPVMNVPTSVATFNCWSAMSVMYTPDHKPIDRIWHASEIDAVVIDTQVIADAPVKLFASGMADAFAKFIETGLMDESYTVNNTPVGMYTSKVMAGATNEIILNRGEQAYRDCVAHLVTDDFDACVFANVATTAIAAAVNYSNHSLIHSGNGKGATFAHALYYACKAKYTEETSEWLHGEIVGLGCQASMYAYGRGEFETRNFARFMKAINQPMSLKDLGLDTSDKSLKELVDCMMVVWGKRPEAHWPIIYDALQRIKE